MKIQMIRIVLCIEKKKVKQNVAKQKLDEGTKTNLKKNS